MLISNQFRSVATQNKENGDKRVKKSNVKRLEGSNINEVKAAQTVNRLPQRKNEFPHLLVEEEQLQNKKIDIIKKRAEGKKNDSTDVDTAEVKNVSTNEVCTFIFFSLFLFICAILQLGIEHSYQANHSIRNWVSNGTFHSDVRGSINLYQLENPTEYYEWLLNFVVDDLYHSDEIGDTKVPQYRKNGVPENNILISPIRITQRMIKTIPNMNSYTNDTTRYHELAEKWISIDQSFGSFDDYNLQIEKNDTVTKTHKGQTYQHIYKKEGSFMELGGYVENIHIHSQSKDEAVQKISDIKNSQYINKNTKHLVTDMMFYNSYSDIYTILIIQTVFKPNGQIDSNDLIFMNIKGAYYSMSNGTMVFRAICEFLFVIILGLYVLQEVNQITKKILQQFEKQMKEEARISLKKKQKEEKYEKAKEKYIEDLDEESFGSNEDLEQEYDEDGKVKPRHHDGKEEKEQTQNEKIALQTKEFSEKRLQELIKLVKLIPLGLKDHFSEIWNMMDVIIFSLAMYIVPLWIYIIVKHTNNFVLNSAQDYNSSSYSNLMTGKDIITSESSDFLAQNIINASQNIEVYKIGYYLTIYANFGGILICFVIIKFLNYIEKFKKGMGMLFEIMSVASNEMQYFAIIMIIVFIAFILSFKTAFGAHFIEFSTERKTFFSLWKFLLKDEHDANIILHPESGSVQIGNVCILIFIFLTQFILNNMIRSIITFSYYKVASMQNNELTLDQILAEKHIFNQLYDEVPNPEKAQELLNENKLMPGIRGKAASYVSEIVQQRMNMKSMKDNIQKDERRVWQKLADIQKERCMLEQKVLEKKNKLNFQQQIRQSNFINPKERQSALMSVLGKVEKLTEIEERQIDQQTRLSKGLKFMQRPTLNSEFPNEIIDGEQAHGDHQEKDNTGVDIENETLLIQSKAHEDLEVFKEKSIQFPIKNLINQKKNVHKKKNESQQDDEEESDAEGKKARREEEKEAERQLQEILEIQEKERSRYILERMDWDKNFGDAGAGLMDDMNGGKPSMMSELEESQEEKIQLIKCGRILWTSIIFGFYMMLVIIVVTLQVYSQYQYKVNYAIDNFIEQEHVYKTVGNISDLTFYNTTTEQMSNVGSWGNLIGDSQNIYEKETDSKLLEHISLRTIKGRKDSVKFFQYVLPKIGKNYEINTAFDFKNFPKQKTNFLGYFINDRNYIVGDSFKFSFKLNEKNKNFIKEMDRLVNNSTYKDLYFDKDKENIYRNDSYQPIQEQNNENAQENNDILYSMKNAWYKSLIAIPQYLKPSSSSDNAQGLNYTLFCHEFEGRKSGFKYECDQHQRSYEIYVNMSISPSEAIELKQSQTNSQVSNFSQMDYTQVLERLIGDGFFDEHLNSIDISFVSYEAYYDMHCYTKISLNFNIAGEVISGIKTKSLRLDILQGTSDYISLGCYLVYYILYMHIFYTFIMGMIDKYMNYRKWEKFEIDYLSETEKKQRHKKKPEFVRIYDVMFDNFTIVNMLYSLLTLISFVKFVQFVLKCKNLQTQPYPIWPNLNADRIAVADQVRLIEIQTFEENLKIMIDEFYEYKTYIAISVLAVTFKLFEYFYQSKSMMQLLNVMTSIKTELTNFLIIFFCLIFAFVLLSFLSFGTFVEEFSSLTKAFICIFEISISSPISYKFQSATDRHSPTLTLFLFLPMTIIFMFIFSNIFLAIMMSSYEMNIGRWRTEENVEENSEEMSLLKSLLCCTIPKEGTNSNSKNKGKQWQSKKEDDVLGIEQIPMMWKKPKEMDIEDFLCCDNVKNWQSQLVQIAQVPEFMALEFNPYDPNSKYNEEDYLTGLDHLEIDMQMSNIPIKLWTQKIAEEIYQELTLRTKVRTKAKLLMEKKFEFLQMSRNQQKANTFDEFSYQQKRIEYWNYIRCTSQLMSFQLKAMNQILKFKQSQIKSLSDKYKSQQRKQDYLYLKVMEIEAPIEQQLKVNMDLGFVVHCLDEKKKLLQNKIDSRDFIGYNEKEQINMSIIKSANSEEDSDQDKLYEENSPLGVVEDSDEENEDSEFEQNRVNLGGVVGQVDMNILKNVMDPIRDEFRQTIHQFSQDAPVEAPVKALVDNLQFQKSPLQDNSQFTDNEHDLSDIKLNMNESRKSLFSKKNRSRGSRWGKD